MSLVPCVCISIALSSRISFFLARLLYWNWGGLFGALAAGNLLHRHTRHHSIFLACSIPSQYFHLTYIFIPRKQSYSRLSMVCPIAFLQPFRMRSKVALYMVEMRPIKPLMAVHDHAGSASDFGAGSSHVHPFSSGLFLIYDITFHILVHPRRLTSARCSPGARMPFSLTFPAVIGPSQAI